MLDNRKCAQAPPRVRNRLQELYHNTNEDIHQRAEPGAEPEQKGFSMRDPNTAAGVDQGGGQLPPLLG